MNTNGFDPAFTRVTGTSSFTDFCQQVAPDVLAHISPDVISQKVELPAHGTTIVAASFNGGVVMAGDRRATAGNLIAMRDIEKVFAADDTSVIGVAGSAGLALGLAKQFQVELEHYAKIEGTGLSLLGKANRLASLISGRLELAFRGLGVVPLFAGWDCKDNVGKVFSYDITGGCYEENRLAAIGSGSVFAKSSLKKLYRDGFSEHQACLALLQSLFDAADEDAATGMPDVARKIYPVIISVTENGVRKLNVDEVEELTGRVLAQRAARPDGPEAELL